MFDKQSYLEQDLHDLKLRYELLEGDRKAYYEQSQQTILSNKTEVAKLRAQNKELRNALGKLKKTNGSDEPTEGARDIEKFKYRVNELHKKADEMVSIARTKEETLNSLCDKLQELKTEANLVTEVSEKSEQAKRMRRLENQLDKAEIKWHEAQAIRKIYEEILERMHEERHTFDTQLKQIEHTLATKRLDRAELQRMSCDAQHARDLTRTELLRIETQIVDDRKRRDKDITYRRELVRSKLEASEKLEQALLASTLNNESAPRQGDTDKINSPTVLEAEVAHERVAEYDEMSKHIKEVMGVDDLRLVANKYEEQQLMYQQVMTLSQANEQKLSAAKSAYDSALSNLDETLALGEHKGTTAKAAARELDAQLIKEQAVLHDLIARDLQLKKMLGCVKAGVQHLWDKVKDDKVSKVDGTQDVTLVLDQCIRKVTSLLETIHGKDVAIEGDLNSIPVHFTNQNTRVRLVPNAFESEDNDSDNGGGGGGGGKNDGVGKNGLSGGGDAGDDEGLVTVVPDREAIKKATMAILNARNKSKGSRRKKKKASAAADDDENLSD